MKEHFCTELNKQLQYKLTENSKWNNLNLNALIAYVDWQEQIKASVLRFYNASEYYSESHEWVYVIVRALK